MLPSSYEGPMKQSSFRRRAFSVALTLALALAGCSSEGYRVDLKPAEAQEAVKTAKGRYFIASLRYLQADEMTPGADDFFIENINAFNYVRDPAANSPQKIERLRAELQRRCQERFPAAFAADGEMAIPVEVSVKAYKGNDQMIGPMICGFTMGLIPGPFSMEHIYEVSVGPGSPVGMIPSPADPFRKATYTQVGWAALFPTGLIPYFWSDTDESPVCYTISNMRPMLRQASGRTLAMISDAIVMQLAAKQRQFEGMPEVVAGPGSVSMPTALDSSKTPAPGGGIIAPKHETPAGGLNGL